MATLNGKTLKDTYTGILKTSDQAGIDGTSKTIETGDGASTALSLSDTEVEVNTLKITTLASGSSDTDMLTVNSSGEVRKKTITDNALSVTHEADSTSDPVVTFTQGGSDYPIQFKGVDGVDIEKKTSGANAVIEISSDNLGINTTALTSTGARGLSATNSGQTFLFSLTARCKSSATENVVSLPPAAAGLTFTFLMKDNPVIGSTTIETASGDFFDGSLQVIWSDNVIEEAQANGLSHTKLQLGKTVTTAGRAGNEITCTAISNTIWVVNGFVRNNAVASSSGTPNLFAT